jgi:ribonuclease HII
LRQSALGSATKLSAWVTTASASPQPAAQAHYMRVWPNYSLERELYGRGVAIVAGVDEVGVGALAGPVVAAAVILAPDVPVDGLADSKLLTPKRRQTVFTLIMELATAIAIGRVEVVEVDRLNVYWAAMEARRRAVEALPIIPAHVLVDGQRRIAGCRLPQTPVVGGDSYSASIAASSIVAKVTRDSLMMEYGRLYPEYGFERHKGYATVAHIAALGRLGPLALHRRSYAPVWSATGLKQQFEFWEQSRDNCVKG